MFRIPSPCNGICQTDPEDPAICRGCLRRTDEIAAWSGMDDAARQQVWEDLPRRRGERSVPVYAGDQTGRLVPVPARVETIVSLVPSLTQSLYDLGVGDAVRGITAYCPQQGEGQIQVGGTKNVRHDRIAGLGPDLILANKEENSRDDILQLEKSFPVWVSDVSDVTDSLHLIVMLGLLTGTAPQAFSCTEAILQELPRMQGRFSGRCAYLIWKKPWMTVGSGTFIHSWLDHLGFTNVFADRQRYPETSLEEMDVLNPEIILLPDEPWNFSEAEQETLQARFPAATVLRVPGRPFTWHGTCMGEAITTFAALPLPAAPPADRDQL